MSFRPFIDKLKSEGVAVIPDFLSDHEIQAIKNEINKLIDQFDYTAHRSVFFTGQNQVSDKYFLDSVDKISFFFEKEAFNDKGELVVPKKDSINKIGHCLHMKNDVFKRVTFSEKVKSLIKELGYVEPKVPQSMYIFKNSKIGGPVVPHKDASFLYTQPSTDLVGLWFPMVDVNLENGCLSYVPKSHLVSKRQYFVRDGEGDSAKGCKLIDQDTVYSAEEYVPIEVKAGSCVLIHGLVTHQSKLNETDQGRPVYTFHLLEMHNKQWDKRNWLQETENYKFPSLYDN